MCKAKRLKLIRKTQSRTNNNIQCHKMLNNITEEERPRWENEMKYLRETKLVLRSPVKRELTGELNYRRRGRSENRSERNDWRSETKILERESARVMHTFEVVEQQTRALGWEGGRDRGRSGGRVWDSDGLVRACWRVLLGGRASPSQYRMGNRNWGWDRKLNNIFIAIKNENKQKQNYFWEIIKNTRLFWFSTPFGTK